MASRGERKTKKTGQLAVFDIERCVGPQAADELRRYIVARLKDPDPRIVLDISTSDALDGSCLAVLLVTASCLPTQGRLAVIASSRVATMLEEWEITDSLEIHTNRADALGALEGAK